MMSPDLFYQYKGLAFFELYQNYNAVYIGQSDRHIETGIKEHTRLILNNQNNSAIAKCFIGILTILKQITFHNGTAK